MFGAWSDAPTLRAEERNKEKLARTERENQQQNEQCWDEPYSDGDFVDEPMDQFVQVVELHVGEHVLPLEAGLHDGVPPRHRNPIDSETSTWNSSVITSNTA